MQIVVNGDSMELEENADLVHLIHRLEMQHGRIAIELNKRIVPRSEHATQRLHPGDVVEVVQAIGGG